MCNISETWAVMRPVLLYWLHKWICSIRRTWKKKRQLKQPRADSLTDCCTGKITYPSSAAGYYLLRSQVKCITHVKLHLFGDIMEDVTCYCFRTMVDKRLLHVILYTVKVPWLLFMLTTQGEAHMKNVRSGSCWTSIWHRKFPGHFWVKQCVSKELKSIFQLQDPSSVAEPVFWIYYEQGRAKLWVSLFREQ